MGDVLQLRKVHEQTQMLLPWHVNGTLQPSESALLEEHLAECKDCLRDLAASRAMRDLYRSAPSAHGGSRSPMVGALGGSSWQWGTRRVVSGWSKAAQFVLAAAAAIAVIVLVVPGQDREGFRLLGSDPSSEEGNAIVLFQPDTAERDLRVALGQAGARFVDGPTASGAYIVQVPEQRPDEALTGLRALPQVVLAEPIDATGKP